jgi:hypothetical protein
MVPPYDKGDAILLSTKLALKSKDMVAKKVVRGKKRKSKYSYSCG